MPIAAFRLGQFLRTWSASLGCRRGCCISADASKAWQWYQKGADSGEPNALARFAERDEKSALAEADAKKRNELLLQAFSRYAAAAERAKEEDWPDDAWKFWRYRRASLARLPAREGMMQQVADAYNKVLEQRTPRAHFVGSKSKIRCACECGSLLVVWIAVKGEGHLLSRTP